MSWTNMHFRTVTRGVCNALCVDATCLPALCS